MPSPAAIFLCTALAVAQDPPDAVLLRHALDPGTTFAWALEVEPGSLPLPRIEQNQVVKTNWFDLFKYPRSLLVSWLGNLGVQTGVYGVALWAPSLFVLVLKVSPQEAAKMMILLSVLDFIGRLSFSWLSEAIGRRLAQPAVVRFNILRVERQVGRERAQHAVDALHVLVEKISVQLGDPQQSAH